MNYLGSFFIQVLGSILGTDFLGWDRSPASELVKGSLLSGKYGQESEGVAQW